MKELSGILTLIAIACLLAIFAKMIFCCNLWYTEEGVLAELQAAFPSISGIIYKKSNFFEPSVIVAEDAGEARIFYLDSNALCEYRLFESDR